MKPRWARRNLTPPQSAPRHFGAVPGAGSPAPGTFALDGIETGLVARVVAVSCPPELPDWGRWLSEIGFLPGEHVTVTARSPWGGDPLVVRVGQSTFALRRAEAACVRVLPIAP